MNYKTMNFEQVVEWCKENNQLEWLKATVAKTLPTKDGKGTRHINFLEVKREFARKFMPEIVPVRKTPKKPSMKEILEAL